MVDKNLLKQQLEKDGFKHIYEWKDEAGTNYPPHKHKDKVTLYIVDGGLTFYFDKQAVEVKKGERFNVPPGKEHTAKVGPDGCFYVVGEMIEGDS